MTNNDVIIHYYNEMLEDMKELISFANSGKPSINLLIKVASRRGVLCYRIAMFKVVHGCEFYKLYCHDSISELMEKIDNCVEGIAAAVSGNEK